MGRGWLTSRPLFVGGWLGVKFICEWMIGCKVVKKVGSCRATTQAVLKGPKRGKRSTNRVVSRGDLQGFRLCYAMPIVVVSRPMGQHIVT